MVKSKSTTSIATQTAAGYRVLGGRSDAGIVLLCDHASNALPAEFGTLGLANSELQRHIAYDIGAAAITEHLSRMLGAPAVLSRYSRLLIDINRGDDDPTLIMRLSDGAVIPGNAQLTTVERRQRINTYWKPYHDAVARVVANCRASGRAPVIFSVHSMTNVWKGVPRPWHVSILWSDDDRLAAALLDGFRADDALVVGDNQPYHGSLEGDTLWQHARPHNLRSVTIEYRQDLVGTVDGQRHWACVTAAILEPILSSFDLRARTPGDQRAVAAATDQEQIMSTSPAPTRTELEAAVYRRLVAHLRERPDVQNIDLMNLAGFCRNCLGNWMQEESARQGVPMSKDAAREAVYGMPYEQWRSKHQTAATAEQQAAFDTNKPHDH